MKAPEALPTSSVGEKTTPPQTRQLSTTSRASGRYQLMPPAIRVNCWRLEDPMYLELWVSSTLRIEPRVGSIGLFTREKVASAVIVASTRFCRKGPITSEVQAAKTEQKLTAVASVLPYDT